MPAIDNDMAPADGEVWLPFWKLEEVPHNMWGDASHRKTWREIAAAFTGNAELYGEWMMRVAKEWQNSCMHNLTKAGDKRAWMGHAAVAMALRCPEDIVREAWADLSDEQREKANKKATDAIKHWRDSNA